MNVFIGLLIAAMVGAIIFLSLNTAPQDKRKAYLKKLKDFLEGNLESIEGEDDSYRITFHYKNNEFVYEDIQQHTFGDRVFYQGYLRVNTGTNLVLSFTERERTAMRDSVSSLQDIHSPWKQNIGKVMLPEDLNRFKLFTNEPALAQRLLADEEVVKIFVKFINMDRRAHPVMSLEVLEGIVVLRFYSSGGFRPSLFDLVENYTAIEPYLEIMTYMTGRIRKVKQDIDMLK